MRRWWRLDFAISKCEPGGQERSGVVGNVLLRRARIGSRLQEIGWAMAKAPCSTNCCRRFIEHLLLLGRAAAARPLVLVIVCPAARHGFRRPLQASRYCSGLAGAPRTGQHNAAER